MSTLKRVVVVGGSLAGIRTVEFLRRGGFAGELVLIGDEPHLPYDRPPLSKQILRAQWTPEQTALRKKSYDDLAVDLRLGLPAVSLDTSSRTVSLEDGTSVSFERLVIATGSRVRRLRAQPELSGIFYLRTIDDAIAIRDAFDKASSVAVIGAGFIGAEVAASARRRGLAVTMIEALASPLEQSLGPQIGTVLKGVHERRGVRVRCGRRVATFLGHDRVEGLGLDDGSEVRCEVVVVGVGVEPAVSWLEGSGIVLDDGVHCDASCRTSVEGVFAAGDVASWFNLVFDEQMRVEHWTNAVEQARHVAASLLVSASEVQAFESVPMFWSDQYDIKVQGIGRPKPGDHIVIAGGRTDRESFVALYEREGRLVGAVGFNQPPKIIKLRKLIGERGTLEAALEIVDS